MPSDQTKERLTRAAGVVFARDGFQRAGVREICALAGVNLALVNYARPTPNRAARGLA